MAKKPKPLKPPAQAPTRIPKVSLPPDDDDGGKPGEDGLTMLQRAFVEHLTTDCMGNATEAAARAGYRSENRDSLQVTASRLLRKAMVVAALKQRIARVLDDAQKRRDAIVMRATASMENFLEIDDDGQPRIDWRKAQAMGALGQIKKLKPRIVKAAGDVQILDIEFEVHDGLEALKLLAVLDGKLPGEAPAQAGATPQGIHVHVHVMGQKPER
jgi:phage terminase small subunit